MSLLLAILCPFTTFFIMDRPIAGMICTILQTSLIGWLPAAVWAVSVCLIQNRKERVPVTL
jgi:uncharacterized membrane protein YqaE (UPF0057 family)